MQLHKLITLTLITLSMFYAPLAGADSFELDKNGKKYLCTAIESDKPTGSLARLCKLAQSGNGETIYHPNGRVFTHYAGHKGASWYYDDGALITHYAGQSGSSWYYSNGRVLTHYAGQKGASWYYANGQVISHYMGQKGATWYYDNGQVMTHSGPELSEEELLYPCEWIQ